MKCTKCLKDVPHEEFHVDKRTKTGYSCWCKECKKKYDLIYRQQEKTQKLYKSENYRNRKKEYRNKFKKENPEKMMWTSAKFRAKRKNLPFNIDVSDIVIPSICPLLNIPIYKTINNPRASNYNSPSIDRIIPELGYVKGNIQIISLKANMIKSSASLEEIILLSENLKKKLNDN